MNREEQLAKMEEIVGMIADEFSTQVEWPRVDFVYRGVKFFIEPGRNSKFTFNALRPRIPSNVNCWSADEEWKKQNHEINESQDKEPETIAKRFKARFCFDSLRGAYAKFADAVADHDRRKRDHVTLVASIVKLVHPLGSRVRRLSDHETEISLYDFTNCQGTISVRGDSVDFKISAGNPDSIECLALAVACMR